MKNIIKHAAAVIMVITAVVGLDSKASAWEMAISFSIAFSIAAVFAYRADKKEGKRS